MKYLLSILTSFVLFVYCNGQNYADSGFTNKAEAKNLMVNGLKEGKWVEYYLYSPEADIMGTAFTNDTCLANHYRLTIYKDNAPIGIVRNYHKNGKLEIEIPYANGKKNGISRSYFENGKIQGETPYVNDRINGTITTYYENGNFEAIFPYTNDTLNGILKEYYGNGKVRFEEAYYLGDHGTVVNYDENGNKLTEKQKQYIDSIHTLLIGNWYLSGDKSDVMTITWDSTYESYHDEGEIASSNGIVRYKYRDKKISHSPHEHYFLLYDTTGNPFNPIHCSVRYVHVNQFGNGNDTINGIIYSITPSILKFDSDMFIYKRKK